VAKLLLVEDDNNLREIYEARLTAEGYDITTAQNGEEALSVAKSVHPDLIISDVMMPRISGFEMLDILRNTDELKNTKIIMLTALGQAEDRGRADNLGADRYLVKSQVTLEDIVKAAEELLSDSAAIPAAAEEPAVVAPAQISETPVVTPVSVEPVASVVEEPATPQPQAADAPQPVAVPQPTTTTEPTDTPAVVIPEPPVEPVAPVAPVTSDPLAPPTYQEVEATVPVPTPSDPLAASTPTTITVADPDPITATPVDPVAPTTQPVDAPTAPNPILASSQSLAAEEEAIQQQIASFAEAPEQTTQQPQPVAADTPPVVPPTPESTANDAVLAQAMSDLTSTSAPLAEPQVATNVEPVPAPAPTPEVVPAPAPTPQPDTNMDSSFTSQQVTGRKTIQPLDDTANVGTPDLQTLLAAEDAKEAVSTNPVVPVAATAPEQPKPAIDPNTIAL
jgi:CheY-like chemotaxis protein